ncbi:MAG: cysteine-rich CWC family protein [Sandaracinus sp.]|nr:cysteine-rich CWC family protein [Sandaracinus sp.]
MSDESKRCALCGAQNECGVAAGASHCWCFDVVIPASLLARIPEELRDRACVCPSCIEREKAGGLPLL